MIEIPDAETLYHHFFACWFPPEDPSTPMLRSDVEQIELQKGQHPRILSPLTEEGRELMTGQLHRTRDAALQDLPGLFGVDGTPSLDWLDALETTFTPEKIQVILQGSNPEKPDNPYLVLCCESGALIATILQEAWKPLQWLPEFPYFESSLFDLNTRLRIPVFHWAIKAISGDERKPLRDKVAATLEFLEKGTVS